MLTIKKNQVVKAVKSFKVGEHTVEIGQLLIISKGGRKPVFNIFLNNDMCSFSMLHRLNEYFEDAQYESKMEKELSKVVFKKIQYNETYRGVGLMADVYFDGKKIGLIENNGCGGDTTARIYGEENIKKLKEIITSIDNIRGKVGFDSDGDKLEALMQYQTLNEYVFISFAKRGELDRKELEKFNI